MSEEKKPVVPKTHVEVVATSKGFYGKGTRGVRIRQGETFAVPVGSRLGAWFEPVDPDDAGKLLSSDKAEKHAAVLERRAEDRLLSDPGEMARLQMQTMRQLLNAQAPMPIPAGKVMELPEPKPTAKGGPKVVGEPAKV